MVMSGEKFGEAKVVSRFVYEQENDHFRRFEGGGDLYEDLVAALVEFLYPEGRKDP
jgi:hypothetical protein